MARRIISSKFFLQVGLTKLPQRANIFSTVLGSHCNRLGLSQVAYSRQPFYSLAGKSQNILEENVSIPKISEEAKKPSLSENFRDMKNVDYYYRRSSIEKNNADDISSRSKAVGGEDGGDLGIAKAGDREDPYDGTSIVSHAKRVLCWEFKPVGPAQTSQQLLCTEKSISLTELVDESGARLRDLRPLQPLVQHRYSSALVRSRSIIFLIFPYKAIIYHNKVEIFHSNDMQLSDTIRRTFASRMRKTTSTCFEMRALECLLIEVIEFWATEFEKIFPRTEALLSRISSRQSGEDLQMMLNMTHQLNYISHHVHNVVKAISEVLNSDEDMSRMYLTERSQEVPIFRAISDHEEVELLFETFQHAAMELEGRIGALKMDVHLTNQFLEIHFDSQRNKLMRFNIFLTTGTLAVGFAAFGASVFGMNLTNGWETDPMMFKLVATSLSAGGLLVLVSCAMLYRRTKISNVKFSTDVIIRKIIDGKN